MHFTAKLNNELSKKILNWAGQSEFNRKDKPGVCVMVTPTVWLVMEKSKQTQNDQRSYKHGEQEEQEARHK